MKKIILIVLLCVAQIIQAQTTYYVNINASGANNGNSWTNAFTNLQNAIDAASGGDLIFVAKGIYLPTTIAGGTANNRDKSFILKNDLKIYGGFTGNENSLNQRNIDSTALHLTNASILSGDIGLAGDSSDNSFHVLTAINLSTSSILNGFTISNGNANVTSTNVINTIVTNRNFGGGIYLFNSDMLISDCIFSENLSISGGAGMLNQNSDPEISNSVFRNNKIYGQNPNEYGGAGMRNLNSSPKISESLFIYNEALSIQGGGGIRNEQGSNPEITNVVINNNYTEDGDGGAGMYNAANSNPILDKVTFEDNVTADQGAGMYNDNSKPEISNSKFINNYAASGGGAMENDGGSDLLLENVLFKDNSTDDNGGAIQNWKSSPEIINSIFINNSAQYDGGALFNYTDCHPFVANCIFENNEAGRNGGAIYNRRNCNPILTNLLITNNYAGKLGGGAYTVSSNGSPCSPVATNITISNNYADSSGGGSFDDGLGNPKLKNSIVHGNYSNGVDEIDAPSSIAPTALFRVIIRNDYYATGSVAPTTFNAVVFADTTVKDYRLALHSPGKDVGNNVFFNAGQTPDLSGITTDLNSSDRIMGPAIDLGAYEVCPDTNQLNLFLTVNPDTVYLSVEIVTFKATSNGGGLNPVYYWFRNSQLINHSGQIYSAMAGIDFTDQDEISVSMKSSDGCDAPDSLISNTIVVEVNSVGFKENTPALQNVVIYPNPNSGDFVLKGNFDLNTIYEYGIYNLLGNCIHTEKFTSESKLVINKSDILKSGLYFLQIRSENQILESIKFLIQ